MFKKGFFLRSLLAVAFVAAPLAVAVAPGNAWEEKLVDYETHHDNPSLVWGTYTDWTNLPKPWRQSEGWPYMYNFYGRYTSSWEGAQQRHGVAVWRVQIPRTGWYELKANYKRTDNRTSAAQYYLYANVTIADIKQYKAKNPIFHRTVDQHGPNEQAGEWWFAEFGAFCMHKGDVSVLVLDAMETDRSSSADAAIWKYMGQVRNGQKCVDYVPPKVVPHVKHLLLKNKKVRK